jgi:hypothetical protein
MDTVLLLQIGWEAIKGNDIQSDIAVDTLSITTGARPGLHATSIQFRDTCARA